MSEPIPIPIPIPVMVRRYECPWCARRRASKATMVRHVAACWLDPANRACKTCEWHSPLFVGSEPGGVGAYGCVVVERAESCAVRDDVEPGEFPVSQCPLWELREASP